jgi:uroporphyrinogen-III synthase
MRLLVTRPEPDARRTAAVLRARGHEVRIAPLLEIEPIRDADLGAPAWHAVVMTSANAARAIAAHPRLAELRSLPVLAVGRRTAQAAREAGFADVASADGDAEDVARLAVGRFARNAVLVHLTGRDRAGDLAEALARRGIELRVVEVYRARAAQHLPAPISAALAADEIDGVLHFSRRSAETYLGCASREHIAEAALRPAHFCISAQAAEPLARAGAAKLLIAPQPQEEALLALVGAG